jgi:hypothetical protein
MHSTSHAPHLARSANPVPQSPGLTPQALLACPRTDLCAGNARARTPLYKAVKRRHLAALALLCSHPRCDVNAGGPLFAAIQCESTELVRALLEAGGRCRLACRAAAELRCAQDPLWEQVARATVTLRSLGMRGGSYPRGAPVLVSAISAGADPTGALAVDDNGNSPLAATIRRTSIVFTSRADVARLLIEHGAQPEPWMLESATRLSWQRVASALQTAQPLPQLVAARHAAGEARAEARAALARGGQQPRVRPQCPAHGLRLRSQPLLPRH